MAVPRTSAYKTNVQSFLHHLFGGDEGTGRLLVPNLLHSFANYSNTIPSSANSDNDGINEVVTPDGGAKMGTFVGVYLPCIQNIFGVILFIRLTWIVGTAGAICGFFIILTCCTITMLTAISMSAIATNGMVPAGGAYFMISRSLGPEFGGAVGILFYLGTTLAGAMYIVGAIEILITYMAPSITLFGDTNVPQNMYNNYRVYGTALLALIGLVVYVGVKLVNKFAAVALACVIFSMLAVYVGIFVNFNGNDKLQMCLAGNQLMQQVNETLTCSKEHYKPFCSSGAMCDQYFEANNVSIVNGIRGLSSGVFLDNMWPSFMEKGEYLTRRESDKADNDLHSHINYQVIGDMTTSFTILVGIFFPSVTGIMAGSNRSGDLADPQQSIPIGTIAAIATTSLVYFSSIFLFAGTVDNLLLRDKFGQSIGGRLVLSHIAWPSEWVILIGSFLSTIGAGLQSLTGAPRLLQAIARDGIIPILEPFCISNAKGEPTRALLLTLAICECGVLLGNVDYLAPLLSMFFLMCYGFVNLACALQTLLKTPNWRPRFKYYHWSLSFLGLGLCITVMFMTSWYYALLTMGIAGCIYKHIEYSGAEKEWGDGIRGLNLSAASFSLLRLEEAPTHKKNWRPQIMILVKLPKGGTTSDSKPNKLFAFASQLKAGKGLTVATTVIENELVVGEGPALDAKEYLKGLMDEERVKGFVEVLCCPDITIGMGCLFQTTGLGRLKPNTVMIGWPSGWRDRADEKKFIGAIRTVAAAKMSLLLLKGIEAYPNSMERVSGNIDIWWIVHDGGLLMLLPFLLRQHRTWKNCKMRIFTVAQMEDNSIQMKKDLIKFLYALRFDAEVEVVEMMNSDNSAYTYERTLIMEQRNLMLRQLNFAKKQGRSSTHPQHNWFGKKSTPVEANETLLTVSVGSLEKDRLQDITPSEKRKLAKRVSWDIGITPDKENIKKMHTAVKLNEMIVNKSRAGTKLVIINLPSPPRSINPESEANYMEYLEVLTEGLERVLLVRGCGQEVITI